ncbi:hypothetical protein C4D60_Mb04t13440 [Musa balbisiana]|uniref:Uncharacterized protein n=1 Tax=Musa balbisiana TaxID=52838 RepID=A0A4S8KBR9_MUSBA|nr:hypothetical protein C4D60_Mb04t13440 [Musa balbisiana]
MDGISWVGLLLGEQLKCVYIYIRALRRLLTSNGPVGRAIVGSGLSRLSVLIRVDRPTSTTSVEPVPLPPLVATLCRRGIVCNLPPPPHRRHHGFYSSSISRRCHVLGMDQSMVGIGSLNPDVFPTKFPSYPFRSRNQIHWPAKAI